MVLVSLTQTRPAAPLSRFEIQARHSYTPLLSIPRDKATVQPVLSLVAPCRLFGCHLVLLPKRRRLLLTWLCEPPHQPL
ncbi:hypothetical protein CEP52_001541 [Fusarium oligoseptatum]|uniref:Uncharacterized protein n=1 Tax=Fusarium oligoseptatum TaxID=2604345 RepID=A0A428UI52_9HYPO|nr:hypothetical protein CEP52_001541 [Fusarium oligoseptatum]